MATPFWTVISNFAFCPNPVTVVAETSANVKWAVDPPGVAVPWGVYPIPALVTDKLVPVPKFPIAVYASPFVDLIDPANPTKVPCGSVSVLIVFAFDWYTVLPTFSASRLTPDALGKVVDWT